MKNDVFKLTQNCIPVNGINRSLICDLHRNSFDIIPNDLYNILTLHEGKTIASIKEHFNNKYDGVIDEYFDFVLQKEYIFLTNTPEWFPKLSQEWHYPFKISNALLDLNKNSDYNIFFALGQLEKLHCKHLEIRFYDNISFFEIEKIMLFIDDSEYIISSIGIALPYTKNIIKSDYQILLKTYPRLSYLIIHNSLKEEFIKPIRDKVGYLIYSKKNLISQNGCGVINSNYFISNIKNYTESLKFNSCLNRKISIDIDGNIKNCPSMLESFGNINTTTLEDALNKPNFKKYWNITKDQIDVCKDCEFRYICTDCRAYKENPENDYSKPLKCGYSPYTNEWEEWSTNPLKQKGIEYYGMQDLVKKND
jgi:SPASM domain peptide maturase of grasp-with-spasm system